MMWKPRSTIRIYLMYCNRLLYETERCVIWLIKIVIHCVYQTLYERKWKNYNLPIEWYMYPSKCVHLNNLSLFTVDTYFQIIKKKWNIVQIFAVSHFRWVMTCFLRVNFWVIFFIADFNNWCMIFLLRQIHTNENFSELTPFCYLFNCFFAKKSNQNTGDSSQLYLYQPWGEVSILITHDSNPILYIYIFYIDWMS